MPRDVARAQVPSGVDLVDEGSFARGADYAAFARLRREAPVAWHPLARDRSEGFWAVVRHADVLRVLRDPVAFSSARGTAVISPYDRADEMPERRSLNASDGAVHTAMRSLFDSAFDAALVAREAAWSRAFARERVTRFVAAGGGDFVGDVAEPLAFESFARVLGVDDDERITLRRATLAIARHADPAERGGRVDAATARIEGEKAIWSLVLQWIEKRRAHPTDDVPGRLVASAARVGLGDEDLAFLLRLVALTGYHSTALAVGGAAYALATHPEASERLARGAAIGPAVDEVLRWTSPLVRFGRFVTADMILAGQHLHRGDRVVAFLRSANHDEIVFAEPSRFDLARAAGPHLAFGAGPHACAGGRLARAQIAAALEALRGVTIETVAPPAFLASSVTSGVVRLELRASAER